MGKTFFIFALSVFGLSFSILADADGYKISNDLSYIDGSKVTKQHIYFSIDDIDIHVILHGDTPVLLDQQADLCLALKTTAGKLSMRPM